MRALALARSSNDRPLGDRAITEDDHETNKPCLDLDVKVISGIENGYGVDMTNWLVIIFA